MQGIFILAAVSNQVQGNYIGTNADGTVALGNGLSGINLLRSSNNTIGGSSLAAHNIISGNKSEGVTIGTVSEDVTIIESNNVVQGNYIGTDVTGTMALGNATNGVDIEGVGASDNTIGGTADGARNVISGNQGFGVLIGAPKNVVRGNYIGTDVTGQTALGNIPGGVELVSGADGSTIGGTTDGARNVISGNQNDGVLILGSNTVVQGNSIGTNAAGNAPLPNAIGVEIINGSANMIGGPTPMPGQGVGNLISGNFNGVTISGTSATGNSVQGDLIGTDVTGAKPLRNDGDGVFVDAAQNAIGGTASGTRNVIAGNGLNGIDLTANASQILVQGNYIGVDATGSSLLGNASNGVLSNGPDVTIGGQTAAGRAISSRGMGPQASGSRVSPRRATWSRGTTSALMRAVPWPSATSRAACSSMGHPGMWSGATSSRETGRPASRSKEALPRATWLREIILAPTRAGPGSWATAATA